jgi:hypothetical protein
VNWDVYGRSVPDGVHLEDKSGLGTDWELLLRVSDSGAAEGGEQGQGLYGAGALLPAAPGYAVSFNFDGYTWDSYSVDVRSEGGRGYWDLFAVGLNQERH